MRSKRPLTVKQKQTLDAVKGYYSEHGVSPSMSELSGLLGRSRPAVHESVMALVKKGHLRHFPEQWRGIEIINS